MAYLHNRHSIRLPKYDYSQPGAYFVTICVKNRKNIFGDIENGETKMNETGRIVEEEWKNTGLIRKYVKLDEYIIMPNHLHGILWIIDDMSVGATRRVAPTQTIRPRTIGSIIGQFKSIITKRIMATNPFFGPIWQRNYFETIIRSEPELFTIRKYIVENPLKWEIDQENQKNCVNVGATRRVAPTDILFCK